MDSLIAATVSSVTPEINQRTCAEAGYRLDVCRATNGAHIETQERLY